MSNEEEKIKPTKDDYIRYFKLKRGFFNFVEICTVFFLASIVINLGMLRPTLDFFFASYDSGFNRMPTGIQILFVTSLDVVFTVIYGISPVQKILLKIYGYDDSDGRAKKNIAPVTSELDDESVEESLEGYIKKITKSSEQLSNTILSRGNLYLFLGILFSICGLVFFYTQAHILNPGDAITHQIIALLPNFGVLFFIELISFFFLKQYRVTMDEFRYYEAIKRSREEILTIVKLHLSIGKESDLSNILDKISFSSQVGKLESGQSTELLESRKLDKNELDSLTRIIEAAIGKLGSGK